LHAAYLVFLLLVHARCIFLRLNNLLSFQIYDGTTCFIESFERFFALNEQAIKGALQSMETGPLFLVFNCDKTYELYLSRYQSKPVYSYAMYSHEEIRSHAVNTVGYSVENIVAAWEFMNSYGKTGPTKGFGRVLAQNGVRLIGLKDLTLVSPRDELNQKKKRDARDDEEEAKRRLKKQSIPKK
jgi:hypothetical protein